MAIVAFAKRRAQFKELLSCSNNLNSSRYFRLMALCGIDVLFTVPLSTFFMINNLDIAPLDPYISWANTHSYFGHIGSYPFIIWSQDRKRSVGVEVTKWSPVLCAFIFFGFFGFADEARKNYWHAYQSFAKRLGYTISSTSSNGATSSGGCVPFFYAQLGVVVLSETQSQAQRIGNMGQWSSVVCPSTAQVSQVGQVGREDNQQEGIPRLASNLCAPLYWQRLQ